MNEREAFEAWAEPELYALDKREGGDIYRNVITRNAWIGWQAALASQAQKEPTNLHCGHFIGTGKGLCDMCANGNYQECRFTTAQAQPPEYTFDQLTKMLMQAATKEGYKVTMKIKWAQPPSPEGEKL
jgi:hypothetical protein